MECVCEGPVPGVGGEQTQSASQHGHGDRRMIKHTHKYIYKTHIHTHNTKHTQHTKHPRRCHDARRATHAIARTSRAGSSTSIGTSGGIPSCSNSSAAAPCCCCTPSGGGSGCGCGGLPPPAPSLDSPLAPPTEKKGEDAGRDCVMRACVRVVACQMWSAGETYRACD
jgi:hypothetical protein